VGTLERLTQKSAKVLRFSEFYQSAERSIRVGSGGVDEKPGLIGPIVNICIDALSDTRSVVTAFQRQFPNEHVRKSMEHDVADAWIAFVRVKISLVTPPAVSLPEPGI
jgi:hypothetical protein